MMQTEQFLDQVQQRAGLTDREAALRMTEAVLPEFGQLRTQGETDDAAAQLPQKIKQMVMTSAGEPEKFSAEEFINRIQTRLDGTSDDAEKAATAVMSTVADAVTEEERVEFLTQLPPDFNRFTTS